MNRRQTDFFYSCTHIQTYENIIDYTFCKWTQNENMTCAESMVLLPRSVPDKVCQCLVQVNIPHDVPSPVYLYYSLVGFYQNHRRYVSSVNYYQLRGDTDLTPSQITRSCDPYATVNGTIIGPCGAIANSMFSDSFKMYSGFNVSRDHRVTINTQDIAWPMDRKNKFKNPPLDYLESMAKPLSWEKKVTELDEKNPENNGYQNEHFMVWMRTAAFPEFRKLWGHIDVASHLKAEDGAKKGFLPKGNYSFLIDYSKFVPKCVATFTFSLFRFQITRLSSES